MSDIVEWLLARLDEDEAAARGAGGMRWTSNGAIAEIAAPGLATHIARHDPARVLAEVAAKRAVVAEHRREDSYARWCGTCSNGIDEAQGNAYSDWKSYPCPTLRALVSVYAGQPGWDESWAMMEVGA